VRAGPVAAARLGDDTEHMTTLWADVPEETKTPSFRGVLREVLGFVVWLCWDAHRLPPPDAEPHARHAVVAPRRPAARRPY